MIGLQLNNCLKFMNFLGSFCIEYNHFYPNKYTWILDIYSAVKLQ